MRVRLQAAQHFAARPLRKRAALLVLRRTCAASGCCSVQMMLLKRIESAALRVEGLVFVGGIAVEERVNASRCALEMPWRLSRACKTMVREMERFGRCSNTPDLGSFEYAWSVPLRNRREQLRCRKWILMEKHLGEQLTAICWLNYCTVSTLIYLTADRFLETYNLIIVHIIPPFQTIHLSRQVPTRYFISPH